MHAITVSYSCKYKCQLTCIIRGVVKAIAGLSIVQNVIPVKYSSVFLIECDALI